MITLGKLIDTLKTLELEVGPDAYVFGGEVQSGDRVLIQGADIVEKSNLSDFSYLTAISYNTWLENKDKLEQGYKAVEIY